MKSLELQMRQMSALLEESNARAAASAMSDSVSARQQHWSGNIPTRVRAAAVNGSDDVEAQELYESSAVAVPESSSAAVAVPESSSAARQSTDSSDQAAAPKAAHSQ